MRVELPDSGAGRKDGRKDGQRIGGRAYGERRVPDGKTDSAYGVGRTVRGPTVRGGWEARGGLQSLQTADCGEKGGGRQKGQEREKQICETWENMTN